MEKRRMITAENIGANIRRLRRERGETQRQLAEFLDYGISTVANYESGYRLPDLLTFLMIAFHYETSLEDFVRNPESTDDGVHDS